MPPLPWEAVAALVAFMQNKVAANTRNPPKRMQDAINLQCVGHLLGVVARSLTHSPSADVADVSCGSGSIP